MQRSVVCLKQRSVLVQNMLSHEPKSQGQEMRLKAMNLLNLFQDSLKKCHYSSFVKTSNELILLFISPPCQVTVKLKKRKVLNVI